MELLHRHSHYFVWGCTFFLKKVDDLVALSTDGLKLNKPPNLPCPAKNVLNCSTGGALVLGCALTNFPCKLCLKIFQVHPLHPLATPMNC